LVTTGGRGIKDMTDTIKQLVIEIKNCGSLPLEFDIEGLKY